jgi:hypothetical protein
MGFSLTIPLHFGVMGCLCLTPRSEIAGAALNGKIYIIGGF